MVADGGGALFEDYGGLHTEMPQWAPGSDGLYFRALIAGQIQIWRASLSGSAAVEVTHDAANVRDFTLNPDGLHLTYHVTATRAAIDAAEQKAADGGVFVDKSVDMAQPIVRGSWVDGKLASERLTGNWFARGDILWQTPARTVELALPEASAANDLSGAEVRQSIRPSVGEAIIRPGGATSALTIERKGLPAIACQTQQCRDGRALSAIPLRNGRDWLVTTQDLAHRQTLSIWRPGARNARTLATPPGLLNGGRSVDMPCGVAARALVCVEAEADKPPRLVRVDLATGTRTLLFDPNAELRRRIDTPVRKLAWTVPDGTHFTADLVLPATPSPPTGYPLVMQYYSCAGFLRGGLGDELPMLPLAARGVATLCINQPPYVGQRDALLDYDRALGGIHAIIDTLAGERLIDRSKIGMWGLSFGSEITMHVAEHSSLLAAVALATSPTEPSYYWYYSVAGNPIGPSFLHNWHASDPGIDLGGWKPHSPVLNIDQIHAPILLQVPEQEARISMQFYSTLSRTTVPVELYAFANEPHIKEQPRHKAAVYQRNLDWFRFWLQGYEDPASDRAEQYTRWRALAQRRSGATATADPPRP